MDVLLYNKKITVQCTTSMYSKLVYNTKDLVNTCDKMMLMLSRHNTIQVSPGVRHGPTVIHLALRTKNCVSYVANHKGMLPPLLTLKTGERKRKSL